MALALLAAEKGLDYVACKSMLGTDIMKTNPYIKQAEDPLPEHRCAWCLPCTLTWPSSTSTTPTSTATAASGAPPSTTSPSAWQLTRSS